MKYLEAKAAKGAPENKALAGAPENKQPPRELDATPAAEDLALELGVDLSTVTGTGVDGRITVPDVRAAAEAAAGSGEV